MCTFSGRTESVQLWGDTLLIPRVRWEEEVFIIFVVIKDVLKISPFINHVMNEADLVGHFKQHELIMNCFKCTTNLYPCFCRKGQKQLSSHHMVAKQVTTAGFMPLFWEPLGNVLSESDHFCLALQQYQNLGRHWGGQPSKCDRTVPVSILRVP